MNAEKSRVAGGIRSMHNKSLQMNTQTHSEDNSNDAGWMNTLISAYDMKI